MPPTQKKEKILIIESDNTFGEQTAVALHDKGYTVTLVKDGVDALKSVYDFLPHLILLDIILKGGDSYEILEHKQADPMIAKIPVFLLSTEVAPINMHKVPKGSVTEFFMSLHINATMISDKVNTFFGYNEQPTVAVSEDSSAKKKLMWVEDDKLIGTILSKKLVSSGFNLFHAKNGEEALEMLKSVTPDIIVLDLVLPSMSGFEILEAIKKDPTTNKIPVMILSNLSKQTDVDHAKTLGAEKFLVKASVSLDQIVTEIRSVCR